MSRGMIEADGKGVQHCLPSESLRLSRVVCAS